MKTQEEVIAEAERLLEASAFEDARDLYREALMLGSPSWAALVNLGIAEDNEKLKFRTMLRQKFPESKVCALAEADLLIKLGYAQQAIWLCSEELARLGNDIRATVSVHLTRMKAAIRARRYELVVPDARILWKAATATGVPRIKLGVLRQFSELGDPFAIPVLRSLTEEPWIEAEVKEFLLSKVRELEAFERTGFDRNEGKPGGGGIEG